MIVAALLKTSLAVLLQIVLIFTAALMKAYSFKFISWLLLSMQFSFKNIEHLYSITAVTAPNLIDVSLTIKN